MLNGSRLASVDSTRHSDTVKPFAFTTRWVPAPDRRARPRPTPSPDLETYRHLTSNDESSSRTRRRLKQGALGLTAVGVLGWIWSRRDRGDEGDKMG